MSEVTTENLAYVRTPDDELDRIVDLIKPAGSGPLRLVDPCCGEGLALARMQTALEKRHGMSVTTFGTEADQSRAEEAEERLDQCLWARYQDARWAEASMDVMLLNPPSGGGELELQFLRETQGLLRHGGLLFYAICRRDLNGYIAARLAGHFDVLCVYAWEPEHVEDLDQIVVVARSRQQTTDEATKEQLRAIGRQAKDAEQSRMLRASPAPVDNDLWGYPDAAFEVEAPGGKPFYLRHREVRPAELAADAARSGARTTRWWRDRMEGGQQLESSTLLPLRDTQIANLLFLGFADNRAFSLEGRRYLFRGQTHLDKADVTSEEDEAQGRTRMMETVKQGGVMLSLETGKLRELDTAGILHLVRHHADAFARAVTEQVPALRPKMTLEPWERACLDQVYRFQRLPGRADRGLTHVQKVIGAVTAEAIERRTPVVVLNADTGSGKTGCAYGAALCLRYHYLQRQSYRWFSEPEHRGGHRRRRMLMKGSGGSERAWMRAYKHPKPFCIAFAAEPHTLKKMANEARGCLPMATVRVAEDVSQVEAFVDLTRQLDHRSIAVLIVPKSMAKLGEGWTWAAFRAHGIGGDQVDRRRPYHCCDCGAVVVYHEEGDDGEDYTYPVYQNDVKGTLAQTPMHCEACGAPLWQYCRMDFGSGEPVILSADRFFERDHGLGAAGSVPDVRYPVAEYIYRRYRDFFDLVIWDEAHDCNGVGTDIVAAYRQLTRAARRGWIELTASNMNGKASGVFTRAFHASPEVRRRFRFDERAAFVQTYGLHEHVTRLVREISEAGRYAGRMRKVTASREAPGVQPHLTLLMVPYTISTMIEDLGAPLPPRLEACDAFSTQPAPTDRFADVIAQYRRLSDFDAQRHPRARASQYQACLAYLNAPWNEERITEIVRDEKTDRIVRDEHGDPVRQALVKVHPTWDIHDDRLLPKEQELLGELDRALSEGHGISVMIAHVGRGIQHRLRWLIDRHLGKGAARYCTAPARRREAWYAQAVRDDVKVIISHPRKLRTGLDLIHYPWIYFYQPVSNLYTMIQAKGRAWRLGQRWPCETHFFYYQDTEEHGLLQQQADKMIADNLLRGGDLSGGLMGMGQQMSSVEATREALAQGDLRHLGVLLEQEAIGDWVPQGQIEAHDRARRAERRARLRALRERDLEAMQTSFQMSLF